jgi:hypothetical protein
MTTKRGRKSVAELTVVRGAFGTGRPPPPEDLTDRQAAIWREVVETEPAEFFATAVTRALLADYCRHRDSSEQLSAGVSAFKPEWLKEEDGPGRLNTLLIMRDREVRATTTLATKLRLTNQSRYQTQPAARAAARAATGTRPWES